MKKIPKIINQEDFEKMLKAVQKSKHKWKKQVMVAMLLGFEAGMRISEVLGYEGRTLSNPYKDYRLNNHILGLLEGRGKRIE